MLTNPVEFQPERFLPESKYEQIDARVNELEVILFGASRRICPGLSMGIRMVQLMAATLVQGFGWELPAGWPETGVRVDLIITIGSKKIPVN
ncbi:Flavonoid 3'-monooxygenase [Nymphaea thermarum]|nr:Flavonoid 3'-monooxygenase [Nymphaea thermarum]